MTLVSAGATSGTAGTAGNTVNWDGVVPAGGSVVITITATVAAGVGGQTCSNQGTVNFDADGNGTNESSALTDDPAVGGATDPTAFTVATLLEIPTLGEAGLIGLCLLLAGVALLRLRRRSA